MTFPSSTQEKPPEPSDMATLLEQEGVWRQIRRGEVVEGVVMRVDPEGILVNLGGKSEGLVALREMQTLSPEARESLQVGDPLMTYVLRPETEDGSALLSVDRARREKGWVLLRQAQEQDEYVEGSVMGRNRGGLVVEVEGVEGFVPLSHLAPPSPAGARPFGDHEVGARLTLKVLEVEPSRRRAVLSERQAWQEWRTTQRARLLEELREGDVRKGHVTSHRNFGTFVDLGGAEGLIHISELSWRPIASPDEVLQVGEETEVYVLRVDREAQRISLSLRQLQPGPWQGLVAKHQEGDLVRGTVTRLTPFGAFARIEGDVEGLVHISELSHRHIQHPKEIVQEGEELTLKILRIEPERRRLGLSLKQAVEEVGDWPS